MGYAHLSQDSDAQMFPEGSYNTKTDTDINLDAFSLILFHSILNYTLPYFTLKNPLNTPIQKETTRSHDKLCRVLRVTE